MSAVDWKEFMKPQKPHTLRTDVLGANGIADDVMQNYNKYIQLSYSLTSSRLPMWGFLVYTTPTDCA